MSVRFKDLEPAQQLRAARMIAGAARALVRLAHGGGGYEAVEAPTSKQRKPAFVELTGEDASSPRTSAASSRTSRARRCATARSAARSTISAA